MRCTPAPAGCAASERASEVIVRHGFHGLMSSYWMCLEGRPRPSPPKLKAFLLSSPFSLAHSRWGPAFLNKIEITTTLESKKPQQNKKSQRMILYSNTFYNPSANSLCRNKRRCPVAVIREMSLPAAMPLPPLRPLFCPSPFRPCWRWLAELRVLAPLLISPPPLRVPFLVHL